MNAATLVYFGGGTLLFFFWAYGIVSFVLDVKNYAVPALRRYRTARREHAEQAKRERERDEKERQLY